MKIQCYVLMILRYVSHVLQLTLILLLTTHFRSYWFILLFTFRSVRSSAVMLQTSKYKSAIPTPPTGSVWSFQGVQTLIGLAIAIPLEYFHAEAFLQKILNFSSENGNGLALAVAALVSQLVMLPGMNGLIRAREEQKVGQPIHHPAPGELASEDDRT